MSKRCMMELYPGVCCGKPAEYVTGDGVYLCKQCNEYNEDWYAGNNESYTYKKLEEEG